MLHPLRLDVSLPRREHRKSAGLIIVALHLALGWGLMTLRAAPAPVIPVPPLTVSLLAPVANRPAEPLATALPRPRALAPATPWLELPSIVVPEAPPRPAAAPVLQPMADASPAPAPQPTVVVERATAAAPVPALRPIPPSAIQYLRLPDIVYPSASRRLDEEGLVLLAVYIDEQGLPQQVEVAQSSGFERLDRAAVAGVRRARFRPYAENGRPMAGWARIPVPFSLER